MRRFLHLSILFLAGNGITYAADHTVVLGQWHAVKTVTDSGQARELRVRKVLVDGRIKEYTSGAAHDVTDRLFVIQRVYRVNDALPKDQHGPQWIWRLDGWISVDRSTGHITQLNLPGFDPEISDASWYRDYAAYCGISEDGTNLLVVAQIGKKKPIIRKEFTGPGCVAPRWDRGPSRVTFMVTGEKTVITLRPHAADLQSESKEEEAPQ